jgi:site-specific DNA-methyltransferase (adenine-specific)
METELQHSTNGHSGNLTPHDGKPLLPAVLPFVNEVVCIDWEDGIKQVFDNSVDLVVTDPPYGMQFQSNYRNIKHKSIQNDDNLDWLGGWCKELKRVCKPEAHLYIFCSWHKVDEFKKQIGAYFNVKNILIWEKNNTGMGDLKGDYAPKYEMILFCSSGSKKLNGGRDANILKAKRTGNENHPTEKPVNLIRYLIEKSSKKGDLVLDTFAGSFSTAQACKEIGRDFICFEIEPDYCQTAKNLLNGVSVSLF